VQKAIIIGAGIAGIATSIRLAQKGYEVDVYEANNYPGGKLTSFSMDGYRFDAGPSLFTLPHLVTELFDLCGERVEDHFSYEKKDTICNYFWEDGHRYNMPSMPSEIVDSLSKSFGEDPTIISQYLKSSGSKYELTNSIFIEKSLHKLSTYFSKETLSAFLKSYELGLLNSLHETNSKIFKSDKLVQLFDRYATYNGSSPYKTPGIMSMIPHLEMGLGTYFPKGGMQSITDSLVSLAERQGVKFHYGQQVSEVILKGKNAIGVVVNKRKIDSEVVVSNMDIFSTYKKLLPQSKAPKRILSQERSSSALIFYWGVKGAFPQLDLHNIIFSNNYKEEFDYIFDKKQVHHDPTIYINISAKCNSNDAPVGCENWFVMINTPSNVGQDWESIISKAKTDIISKINRNLKIDLESLIQCETSLDPRSIETKTMSHQGSLYGTSSNNRFAAFLRHPNFSKRIKGLYFVGGSVHPGGGIPLCLNSAKIVSNLL